MLIYSAEQLHLDGLTGELAEVLVANRYFLSLADLLELHNDCLTASTKLSEENFSRQLAQQGFPPGPMNRLLLSLEQAKQAPWDRWIAALNLPQIGIRMGKLLAEHLGLAEDGFAELHLAFERAQVLQVDGLGQSKKEELLRAARDPWFQSVCWRLYRAGVRPRPVVSVKVKGQPLAGWAICITGEFYSIGSREYIAGCLQSLGAQVKTGVSSKVTHLLVGEDAGQVKLTRARQLNIPTLDEDWLETVFEQHDLGQSGFIAEQAD